MITLSRAASAALVAVLLLSGTVDVFAGGRGGTSSGAVSVGGYYRNDGTYVQPYIRSAPDSNPYNPEHPDRGQKRHPASRAAFGHHFCTGK